MCNISCNSGLLLGVEGGKNILGHAAVSLAGHDAGKIYFVIGVVREGKKGEMLLLANGKSRSAAKPKAKKRMHVRVLKAEDELIKASLLEGRVPEDHIIARKLKEFRQGQQL